MNSRKLFKEKGYLRVKLNEQTLSSSYKSDLNIIRKNFDELPPDPYASAESNRFRAYSNLVVLPWERKLHWIPTTNEEGLYVSSYWQGNFNPDYVDNIRYFSPISTEVKQTDLLRNLILHDLDLTFWNSPTPLPIYVGVHFVKLFVMNKEDIAFSSPDLLHRDGEAFTFAHLFSRYNVNGGKNYIAKPEYANAKLEAVPQEHVLAQFELQEPLESYGVCDALVSHYVSPICMANEQLSVSYREMILIDFSPLQQYLS